MPVICSMFWLRMWINICMCVCVSEILPCVFVSQKDTALCPGKLVRMLLFNVVSRSYLLPNYSRFSIKSAFVKFSMLKYFHLQKKLVCQKAESFLKASRSWPNRFKTVSGPPPPRDYSIIWNLFSVFSCRPQRRRVARIAYLECFEKWKAWIT